MSSASSDRLLARQLEELAAIHESLRALTSTLELPEILRAVLGRIKAFTSAEGLSLLLYDAERDELVFAATETLVLLDPGGEPGFAAPRTLARGVIDGIRLPADRGIAGWVARRREAVRLADASADPRHWPGLDGPTGLVPRSMICVPVVKNDRMLGVIQVINKRDGAVFNEDELRLVQTLADHAAIALENASLYRDANTAAITDDLTGLGNTRHFNRVLPELVARGGPLTLLVLDLDNFKALVDREGHLVGSRTIGAIGGLIAAELRPGDVAARFGGDEFVVILPGTTPAAARPIAEAMRVAIADFTKLEPGGIDVAAVTASVGLAGYPDHARDAETLFRAADAAMYAVKRRGKNAVAAAG